MFKLANKVALVTGGSRGIGAAIAKRLANDGASVAITYAKDAGAASAQSSVVSDEPLSPEESSDLWSAWSTDLIPVDGCCSKRSDTLRQSA
jgi:NAD(P)-dependent dehydrogenase (short-subunit alcohol dehydrogenase family)